MDPTSSPVWTRLSRVPSKPGSKKTKHQKRRLRKDESPKAKRSSSKKMNVISLSGRLRELLGRRLRELLRRRLRELLIKKEKLKQRRKRKNMRLKKSASPPYPALRGWP